MYEPRICVIAQFSREYGRLFGAPPLQDITNLRQVADSEEGIGQAVAARNQAHVQAIPLNGDRETCGPVNISNIALS